jgi:hypothetical protein
MQFKDLLRGAVLLTASAATALVAVSAVAVNSEGDDTLAALMLGWWIAAIGIGIWLGRPARAERALAGPLAAARTSTQLPSESPGRIAFNRLWPIAFSTVLAGICAPFVPQVPAIAAGFALMVAAAWRSRDAAVTAVEERDGITFYVENGTAFEPVKLVRTPGLRRGRPA